MFLIYDSHLFKIVESMIDKLVETRKQDLKNGRKKSHTLGGKGRDPYYKSCFI